MPRIFIAIDLPEHIKLDIANLQDQGIFGVSWMAPEQIHLTLRFIGEVGDETLDDIKTVLTKVRCPAFEIALNNVGAFPKSKSPKVLWAGVSKNEILIRLKNKIEHQINRIGIAGDNRKFSPHVTIGRIKQAKSSKIKQFLIYHSLFKSEPIPVSEFILYSSVLTPKGAIHKKEEIYELSE